MSMHVEMVGRCYQEGLGGRERRWRETYLELVVY